MNKHSRRAAILGIAGNSTLFLLKVVVGLFFNSLAIISDAFNSLTDIASSIVVYISVKVGARSADKGHPFGHHRAEPIASMVIAIFTGVLGFSVIIWAVNRLISGEQVVRGYAAIIVLAISMAIKLFMHIYTKKIAKETNSTALMASAIDHRNDILISFGALIGVGGAFFNNYYLDSIVALFIGVWIIKSGYDIGAENIKFLMGESPPKSLIKVIGKKALSVKGVKGVHDIRAHYIGVYLQVEAHISLSSKLSLIKAHSIGKKVKQAIETIDTVDAAFIHIDPIK